MQLMKKVCGRIVCAAFGVVWLGLAAPLSADTLFDNTANDLHARFNPGTYEVGDQITLAGIGNLTYFSFEWWGTNTLQPDNSSFAGAIQADVRFYYNTGTPFNGYASPGETPFYDSGWFLFSEVGATPTARSTFEFFAGIDFDSGGLPITSPDITWTIQFTGMGATDSVGVDLYSPPVVGAEVGDFGDYWQYNGGWSLLTNTVAMDFGALMQTPEPSSMTLSLVGGLGILIATRWFRRKE
jgi:hypothetical protein